MVTLFLYKLVNWSLRREYRSGIIIRHPSPWDIPPDPLCAFFEILAHSSASVLQRTDKAGASGSHLFSEPGAEAPRPLAFSFIMNAPLLTAALPAGPITDSTARSHPVTEQGRNYAFDKIHIGLL
jgi:hypothetical protein